MKHQNYLLKLKEIRNSLPEKERSNFDQQIAIREKSPNVALILGILLGGLGIDRFYVGSAVAGILKLFTLGGLGIWWILDWFLIIGATRKRNIRVAEDVRTVIT